MSTRPTPAIPFPRRFPTGGGLIPSTIPANRAVCVNSHGWVEFGSSGTPFTGWSVSPEVDGPFVPIEPGDVWPQPPTGRLYFVAGSGSVRLLHWSEEEGAIRAASRSTMAVNVKTAPGALSGFVAPTRIALGAAASQAVGTTTRAVTIKAKTTNAAVAYVSDTTADAGGAGTRFELYQGDFHTIYFTPGAGNAFSHVGTAGDHLFIWEHT